MSGAGTFVNFPPAPSDPVTPLDIPSRSGTPNSTTTTMSELSTVAIKDGHRGHLPHHHHPHPAYHQLDVERADRISRLAGLERVTTARNPLTPPTNLTPGAAAPPPAHSYFDSSGNPAMARERSTVGSASATGSVGGGNTTWAGSDAGDHASNFDKMSESQDMDMDADVDTRSVGGMDTRSVGGMSEEGAPSLVAFGEGARTPARQSVLGSSLSPGAAASVVHTPTAGPRDRHIHGVTYDADVDYTMATVRGNRDTTSADRMRVNGRS